MLDAYTKCQLILNFAGLAIRDRDIDNINQFVDRIYDYGRSYKLKKQEIELVINFRLIDFINIGKKNSKI